MDGDFMLPNGNEVIPIKVIQKKKNKNEYEDKHIPMRCELITNLNSIKIQNVNGALTTDNTDAIIKITNKFGVKFSNGDKINMFNREYLVVGTGYENDGAYITNPLAFTNQEAMRERMPSVLGLK
jgi:hypothetical protein